MSAKTPDLSTLPQRMWFAADVIGEVINRIALEGGRGPVAFASVDLRCLANRWEAEDRKAGEQAAQVDVLAAELDGVLPEGWIDFVGMARKLIESGWRKDGDPS
jgi:hypothetical protein